jgi:hypothetical protein
MPGRKLWMTIREAKIASRVDKIGVGEARKSARIMIRGAGKLKNRAGKA